MRSTIYNHEISIDKMKGKKNLLDNEPEWIVESEERGRGGEGVGGEGGGRGRRREVIATGNGSYLQNLHT